MKLLLCFRSEKEKKGKGKDDEVGDVRANRKDAGADPASSAGPKEESDNRSQLPTFTLQELAAATKDFSHECLIGQGGFGDVYKGTLERNGQVVAIKKLNQSGLQGNQEFLVEVLMLSLLRHPNLVTLCGFCAEEKQRMLVYEYMPLGSLHDHLHGNLHDPGPDKEPLDWNTRIKIAAGAAEGLEFLHHKAEPAVIYRDLKASNILLGEGFHPKLSDFGLAKFGPSGDKSHVSTRVMGTRGYCAPEYAESGKLTAKSDIYSFGVVLLELITGRRALDVRRVHDRQLLQWASPMLKDRSKYLQLADPLLRGQFPESVFKKTVDIAILCLQGNANNRPSMQEVVAAMEYLKSRKYCPEKVGDVDSKSTGNDSPDQTKTPDSEQAVTEARVSGESCREKQQQSSNDPDG